jgi:hypothetical protein
VSELRNRQDEGAAKAPAEGGSSDPKAPGTLAAAIVGALVVLAVIFALQAYFHTSEEAERERKIYAASPEELTRLRAEQLERMNAYRWVDPARGVVAVPIDRAMELTVRDQGRLPGAGEAAAPGAGEAAPAAGGAPAGSPGR